MALGTLKVNDGDGAPQTIIVWNDGSNKMPAHLMYGLDGTTLRALTLNGSDELAVSVSSLPLPSGAATQTTMAQISSAYWADGATPSSHRFVLLAGIDPNGDVQAIATDLAGRFLAPAGQATEAKQDTANASLGATTEGAAASDTATSGLVGLTKRLLQRITTLLSVLPGALGQTNSAGSFPVVIANNQSAVPVSGSVTVSGTVTANLGTLGGAATETTLSSLNGKVVACNTGAVVVSSALPTGANVIGSVAARLDASSMSDGAGTALTPKFAAIAESTSGDRTIIAAVTGKKIRVLAFRIKAATASSAAVSYYWRNGAGGSALEGGASNTTPLDKTGAAGAGGETAQFNPVGWFETSANTALVLNLSASQAVTGSITYVEV